MKQTSGGVDVSTMTGIDGRTIARGCRAALVCTDADRWISEHNLNLSDAERMQRQSLEAGRVAQVVGLVQHDLERGVRVRRAGDRGS